MRGEFQPALEYYNQALTSEPKDEEKCALARAGIARTTIQLGDVRRGRQMALESASAQLCRECAAILEGMKHMQVRGLESGLHDVAPDAGHVRDGTPDRQERTPGLSHSFSGLQNNLKVWVRISLDHVCSAPNAGEALENRHFTWCISKVASYGQADGQNLKMAEHVRRVFCMG
jgi:hypothetical protein